MSQSEPHAGASIALSNECTLNSLQALLGQFSLDSCGTNLTVRLGFGLGEANDSDTITMCGV